MTDDDLEALGLADLETVLVCEGRVLDAERDMEIVFDLEGTKLLVPVQDLDTVHEGVGDSVETLGVDVCVGLIVAVPLPLGVQVGLSVRDPD